MRVLDSLLSLLALLVVAYANTEKVIFTAPDVLNLPDSGPALNDLQLISLSPAKSTLRASLPVSFEGEESWYLLQRLHPGQRYELRVCWAATASISKFQALPSNSPYSSILANTTQQPTSFAIDTYSLAHVFDTPHLIQSLANCSEGRQDPELRSTPASHPTTSQSVLFLHLTSTADFFSTNATLMKVPPLVDADIILDPYLWNAIPQSLISTGFYIILTALAAWLVSGVVWRRLFSPVGQKRHTD